jgi:hypothetical protein
LLQKSLPALAVLDEAALSADHKCMTLPVPLSAVPPGLLGLVQREHRPHGDPRANQEPSNNRQASRFF